MRVAAAPDGKYRHWDTLKHVPPPGGLSSEEWWALIKSARNTMRREIALVDREGRPFAYTLPDPLLERLHRVDREASGRIELPEVATNAETRDRYVVSSLAEEAITSSQLEGAATTRRVAKEMIRTGRAPRTKGELMILNNFRAMEYIRTRVGEPLTEALIFEIHRLITQGTLDGESQPLRQPGDGIAVYSDRDELLHRPPPAEQIKERLAALCTFANHPVEGIFLHPLVKAILLHFWLAYDHPFVDGNGRTARALFYWFALKEGYWLMEYVSISSILKKAPARYGRSFLYTETDENDLTYFILAQLRVIEQAIDALQDYLQRKMRELREVESMLRPGAELNHRQLALVSHALRHPGQSYTIASHQKSHGVVYATARADLNGLAERGLVTQQRRGRAFRYRAVPDLAARLRSLDVSVD